MKKIKLYRPTENFNKNYSYKILVDGKKVTDLKNGEEKIIEVSDEIEESNLKAKIQWCGSKNLTMWDLNKSEIIKVTGNEFLNRKMPLIGAVLPLTGIIIFSETSELFKQISIGLLVLLLVGLIGTLTFWKNKWIKMETE